MIRLAPKFHPQDSNGQSIGAGAVSAPWWAWGCYEDRHTILCNDNTTPVPPGYQEVTRDTLLPVSEDEREAQRKRLASTSSNPLFYPARSDAELDNAVRQFRGDPSHSAYCPIAGSLTPE